MQAQYSKHQDLTLDHRLTTNHTVLLDVRMGEERRSLAGGTLHGPAEALVHKLSGPLPDSLRVFLRVTGPPNSTYRICTTLVQEGAEPREIVSSGTTSQGGIGLEVLWLGADAVALRAADTDPTDFD